VKVTPGTQSLILAGEPTRLGGRSGSALDEALGVITNGASLNRVTIVASRPDSAVLLLRADYSPRTGTTPLASRSVAPKLVAQDTDPDAVADAVADADVEASPSSSGALVPVSTSPRPPATVARSSNRDSYGNLRQVNHPQGNFAYLTPVEQYARTQRSLDAAPGAQIDVHA
jgi:hypothetical protein